MNDLEKVIEIEESSFSPPWEKHIFHAIAKNNGRFRVEDDVFVFMDVLVLEDKTIGYIVWEEDNIEANGHILNLAIAMSERCKGYGTKLLESTIAKMMESKLLTCELEVRESNRWARYLYEKVGMIAVDKIREYYDNEDAIIYEITFE